MGVSARGQQGGGGGLSCSQLPISRAGPPGVAKCPPQLPGPERLAWVLSGATGWCSGWGGTFLQGGSRRGGSGELRGLPVMGKAGPFSGGWAAATDSAGCWTVTWMLWGLVKAPRPATGPRGLHVDECGPRRIRHWISRPIHGGSVPRNSGWTGPLSGDPR